MSQGNAICKFNASVNSTLKSGKLIAKQKREERGNVFRVVNERGHLQAELVALITSDDNRWKSMTIDNNQWQLMIINEIKSYKIFVIYWSSMSNINRLIGIDCYQLIWIIINHRFHLLIMPGLFIMAPSIPSSPPRHFSLLLPHDRAFAKEGQPGGGALSKTTRSFRL